MRIQPIGFSGRREATSAPTVGKVEQRYAERRVAEPRSEVAHVRRRAVEDEEGERGERERDADAHTAQATRLAVRAAHRSHPCCRSQSET